MKDLRILIVDENECHATGHELERMIDSCQRPFKVAYSSTHNGGSPWNGSLTNLVSNFEPHIIFHVAKAPLSSDALMTTEMINRCAPAASIISVVDGAEPDQLLELLRTGASDFVTCPLNPLEIVPRICRLSEQAIGGNGCNAPLPGELNGIIGRSPCFRSEIEKIPMFAACDASILILGSTGTGKELFARSIHHLSKRAGKPFIPVNCGAIPLDLMENELFGHEKGAYTGASQLTNGLIHEADGGTLFLDEIDSLPPQAQVKLLRFLQEKEFKPLGSSRIQKANVRVIAASNTDLEQGAQTGRIREDLFYRLSVLQLRLPPLKERPDDIPLLSNHFLKKYTSELKKNVGGFTHQSMQKLMLYSWPGNVRQLEHVIHRAVLTCRTDFIEHHDLTINGNGTSHAKKSFQELKAEAVSHFEKAYLQNLLSAHRGNISRAARDAQKDRRALWELIRRHKIDVQEFREPMPALQSD